MEYAKMYVHCYIYIYIASTYSREVMPHPYSLVRDHLVLREETEYSDQSQKWHIFRRI